LGVQLLGTTPLLRQYFRKGEDLSTVEPADVLFAAEEINSRPRAVLDWSTASAKFAAYHRAAAKLEDPLRVQDVAEPESALRSKATSLELAYPDTGDTSGQNRTRVRLSRRRIRHRTLGSRLCSGCGPPAAWASYKVGPEPTAKRDLTQSAQRRFDEISESGYIFFS
jgi:hypothetical protein